MTFLYPFSGLEQVCGGSLPAIDKQTVLSATTRSSNLSINRLRDCNKTLNSWACYRSWKCSTMKCVHVPQWFKLNGFLYNFLSSDTFINMAIVIIVFLPLLLFFYFSAFWSVRIDASFQYDWLFPCHFSIFWPVILCIQNSRSFVVLSFCCLIWRSVRFLLVLKLGMRRTFLPSAPYICMSLCLFMWSFLSLYLLDITTVCVFHLQRLSRTL